MCSQLTSDLLELRAYEAEATKNLAATVAGPSSDVLEADLSIHNDFFILFCLRRVILRRTFV